MTDALHAQLYASLREMRERYLNCAPVVRETSCEFAGRSGFNIPENHRCKSCVLTDARKALYAYEARS